MYLCNTKISSENLLSVNLTTREYVFVLPNAKNLSREINSVYSILSQGRSTLWLEFTKVVYFTTVVLNVVHELK